MTSIRFRLVEALLQDARYGLRQLRRAPGLTSVALLTLAFGIGANVAIFTVADLVLLRRAPYPDSDRLVEINDVYQGRSSGVGQEEFREWASQADLFERLALVEFDSAMLRAPGQVDAERIVGNRVTDGFFEALRAAPLYGRTFLPGEDLPGRTNVVVLSHSLWTRSFGANPRVVGTHVALGDTSYEVIGVMPRAFFWTDSPRAEFWRPLGYQSSGRMQHQYTAVGRLDAGVSLASAQARMDAMARRAEEQYPSSKGWSIRVRPLGQEASVEARTPILALSIAASLVLLIACANVASLLTVRTVSRAKEIAVRTSLGATRGRVIRQLLVEGALLASIGGTLGTWLSTWILQSLTALMMPAVALPPTVAVDARALIFSVALTALTTLLFGMIPALKTMRIDPVRAMTSSSAGTTIGPRRQRFLRQMVVSELALATVLLIAATLLITSLGRLLSRDLGFQPDHVLTFNLQIPASRYDREHRGAFFFSVIDRLNALPGIETTAATDALPMSGVFSGSGFDIDGRPTPIEWRQQSAQYCGVTAGYFRTMRIALISGRDFIATEPAPVAIISDALARRHWPNEDPIGRRIGNRARNRWMTIVGVVADTRYGGPTREPNPTIYVPHDATSPATSMFVAVRLRPSAGGMLPLIRQTVRQMEPAANITRVATLDELTGRSVAVQRSMATLLGVFAAFAIALAAIGTYGLIAYSVQQRTQEMGIRLALGAAASQVRNMILLQGIRAAAAGVIVGTALALGVTRFIASYLFGIAARDLVVFTAIPLAVMAVAIVSVWIPARRTLRVDPAIALRAQ